MSSKKTLGTYLPLPVSAITKKWTVCAAIPHLKDPYWLAVNYGLVAEARRDRIRLKLVEAGGYTNLPTQINQVDDCAASGADAIVLGAISFTGLDAKVAQLEGNGIRVVDVITGISTPKTSAHALVSYFDEGWVVGQYLRKLSKSQAVNVGFFPGPPGAGWVEDTVKGFKAAIQGSKVNLLTTRYGDTGKEVQVGLVQDALTAMPEMNFVVGTAVTTEAAVPIIASRNLQKKVKLLATYLTPETFAFIKRGAIACGPQDSPVVQARMAVDQAVRLLEKKGLLGGYGRVGPPIRLACGPGAIGGSNLKSVFVYPSQFAPAGFKPVFEVG
jgi:protein TorT